jgi:flavin-dependent dehydrogenase
MADYDIVTVGGGVGGAAVAKAMAARGYRVLAVEREKQFKDPTVLPDTHMVGPELSPADDAAYARLFGE